MPRKCTNLGRRSRNARKNRLFISRETEAERELRLAKSRERSSMRIKRETSAEREFRLRRSRERNRKAREKLKAKNTDNTGKKRVNIENKSEEKRLAKSREMNLLRIKRERELRRKRARNRELRSKELNSYMNVDSSPIEYKPVDSLGTISVICENCSASIWKGESRGLCCFPGIVKLEEDISPTEALHLLQISKYE